jgi:hypothetical protein
MTEDMSSTSGKRDHSAAIEMEFQETTTFVSTSSGSMDTIAYT